MIGNKIILERRAYNEDATDEEIQLIKDNVYMYDSQIIYLDEMPVVSPFSIHLVFDRIEKYSAQLSVQGLIIDIRKTRRPDAKARRVINQRFSQLCDNLTHVSFCTGKNLLINTAARFVMYQTNLNSFSIDKTPEEAIAKIKKQLD